MAKKAKNWKAIYKKYHSSKEEIQKRSSRNKARGPEANIGNSTNGKSSSYIWIYPSRSAAVHGVRSEHGVFITVTRLPGRRAQCY